MSSLATIALALQLPGVEGPEQTFGELAVGIWEDGGFMMWPLGFALAFGTVIIIFKLIDLNIKAFKTRGMLRQVDELLEAGSIQEAMDAARESKTPAGRVLVAGLERSEEGSERISKAIENVGLIEMAGLEKGLVWLATVANVAPLLGFLGTVIGMILAFQAIEMAGEVEATLVAGGIKVALITTASGLAVAIPMNIAHNYFVTQVDRMVLDMEESAQKMVDAIHQIDVAAAAKA